MAFVGRILKIKIYLDLRTIWVKKEDLPPAKRFWELAYFKIYVFEC